MKTRWLLFRLCLAFSAIHRPISCATVTLLGVFPETSGPAKPIDTRREWETAFHAAVAAVNADTTLLRGHTLRGAVVRTANPDGSAAAAGAEDWGDAMSVCSALPGARPAFVIGPHGAGAGVVVEGPFGTLRVPSVTAGPVAATFATEARGSAEWGSFQHSASAPPSVEAAALASAVVSLGWSKVAVLFADSGDAPALASSVLLALSARGVRGGDVSVMQFPAAATNVTSALEALRSSDRRISILIPAAGTAGRLFGQIRDAGLLGPGRQWLGLSGLSEDPSLFEIVPPRDLVGLLVARPHVQRGTPAHERFLLAWSKLDPVAFPGAGSASFEAQRTPFVWDAVWLAGRAISRVVDGTGVGSTGPRIPSFAASAVSGASSTASSTTPASANPCASSGAGPWALGGELLATARTISFTGASGPMSFGLAQGSFSGAVEIANLQRETLASARWIPVASTVDVSSGVDLAVNASLIEWSGSGVGASAAPRDEVTARGGHFRLMVMTPLPPFVVFEAGAYSGLSIDVMQQVASRVGFTMSIETTASSAGGTGRLIDAVERGDADFAIAAITINAARLERIRFSQPYFDLGLRLLVRKTVRQRGAWLFLEPFSAEAWFSFLAVFAATAITLFAIERGTHSDIPLEAGKVQGMLTALWITSSSWLRVQNFRPRTLPGRLVSMGLFYTSFVGLVIHTASLASILSTRFEEPAVGGLEDLKSGAINPARVAIPPGTAIEEFYVSQVSNEFTPYTRSADMRAMLRAGDIDAGINDGPLLEYRVKSVDCDMQVAGAPFFLQSYGIAINPRLPVEVTRAIDLAILELRENGELDAMRRRWFSINSCIEEASNPVLTVGELSGLFVVFIIVILMAVISFAVDLRTKRKIPAELTVARCLQVILAMSRERYREITNIARGRTKIDRHIVKEEEFAAARKALEMVSRRNKASGMHFSGPRLAADLSFESTSTRSSSSSPSPFPSESPSPPPSPTHHRSGQRSHGSQGSPEPQGSQDREQRVDEIGKALQFRRV